MSTDNTVASDYGLTDEAPATAVVGGGKERRIWRTTSVAPDPHRHGCFYAVQELAGEWVKVPAEERLNMSGETYMSAETVQWRPRDKALPPVTRVLLCRMDQSGAMINVYKDASQGKSTVRIPF